MIFEFFIKILKMSFTKIKDLDRKILLELNYKELLIISKVNKYLSELCKNGDLWRNKIEKDFSPKYKGNLYIVPISKYSSIKINEKGYLEYYRNKPRILYETYYNAIY
jgi:hypothetical protein